MQLFECCALERHVPPVDRCAFRESEDQERVGQSCGDRQKYGRLEDLTVDSPVPDRFPVGGNCYCDRCRGAAKRKEDCEEA